MQSLRHGFAKRTTRIAPSLILRFKCRTAYAQRTSAGLIISEATQVSQQGYGYAYSPGIHSPEQVEGWKLVTQAVHERGRPMFLQLWHVGRISHPSMQPNGKLPVAPSAIAAEGMASTHTGEQPFVIPRAFTMAPPAPPASPAPYLHHQTYSADPS
ncbi:MAG: hypothetical protein RH949_28820 [Coleofasciculus sp. A1-SPW-01]